MTSKKEAIDNFNIDKVIKEEQVVAEQSQTDIGREIALQYINWLSELKQYRESALRPTTRFLRAKPREQFEHLISEVCKVKEAHAQYIMDLSSDRLVEELIDLQMSIETMLAILGLDEQQRNEARRKVIEKKRSRGYYECDGNGAKLYDA